MIEQTNLPDASSTQIARPHDVNVCVAPTQYDALAVAERWRRMDRAKRRLFISMMTLDVVFLIALGVAFGLLHRPLLGLAIELAVVPAFLPLFRRFQRETRAERAFVAEVFEQEEAVGAIGCWLDIVVPDHLGLHNDAVTRKSADARERLIALLPRLTEAAAPLVDRRQRKRLALILTGESPKLISAALAAITTLGCTEALSNARKLAAGEGAAGRHPELQPLAEACVERLEAIARTLPSELLRASSEGPGRELLLRPASSGSEEDLLRPEAEPIREQLP